MAWLQSIFSTPARQALGWTALGLIGIAMAAGGVWFLTEDDGGPPVHASSASATATAADTPAQPASRTAAPSATSTASATPAPTESPPATATTRPAATTGGPSGSTSGGAGAGSAAEEPTVAESTTPPPVVAGGDYCPNNSSSAPPNSVIGIFTIGGAPAPAGTNVSLAFDGIIGPTRATAAAGGYRVDYGAGPQTCANRVGATISVVYNGVFYPTGHTVGDSPGAPVNVPIAAP